MKDYIKSLPKRMAMNKAINILGIGLLIYFMVSSLLNGEWGMSVMFVGALFCYIFGGYLGNIKKYIPLVLSIASDVAFVITGIIFFITHNISDGMISYAVLVMLFSMVGFVNLPGKKCISYGISLVGSGCVIAFGLSDNGMVVWMAALVITLMMSLATYTAMFRYVLCLFSFALTVKAVGIIFFINKMELFGIVKELYSNPMLAVAVVFLGLLSLLMRERHPRIKSDRDKKFLPVLRQWQVVIGVTLIVLYIWGILGFDTLFFANTTGGTYNVVKALMCGVLYFDYSVGSILPMVVNHGFLILTLLMITLICVIYESYEDYKAKKEHSDLLLVLVSAGFVAYFMCCHHTAVVILLYALLAGMIVNGDALQ